MKSMKMVTNRFLGLGGGQRRGRDVGSLLQKHFECGWIQVLHCKTSPWCLKGHEKKQYIGWTGLISCHARKIVKDCFNNITGAQRRFTPRLYCSVSVLFGHIPEWDRQLQGSVCWSVFVFASAAPSGRSQSLRFPVKKSTAEFQLINSLLTIHLQAAAGFKRPK